MVPCTLLAKRKPLPLNRFRGGSALDEPCVGPARSEFDAEALGPLGVPKLDPPTSDTADFGAQGTCAWLFLVVPEASEEFDRVLGVAGEVVVGVGVDRDAALRATAHAQVLCAGAKQELERDAGPSDKIGL